jgi:acyl carrier protein
MPTKDEIKRLCETIENVFCIFDVLLSDQSTLAHFSADELDAVEFIMAVEEEFKVDLSRFYNSSLEEIQNVPLFEFVKPNNPIITL